MYNYSTMYTKLSLLLLSLYVLSSPPPISGDSSAYAVLTDYNFPVGLLPKGASGYTLNATTGAFKAYLSDSTCAFTIGSYKLKYKSPISGKLSKDKLSSLKGVYVKVWLFWLTIVEVSRDGDELEFSVGIASAKFPVGNFGESPTCGCGFDCGSSNEQIRLNEGSLSFLKLVED